MDHVFLVKIQDVCAAYQRFKRIALGQDVERMAENVSLKSVLMVSSLYLDFSNSETRMATTTFAVHPEKFKSAC